MMADPTGGFASASTATAALQNNVAVLLLRQRPATPPSGMADGRAGPGVGGGDAERRADVANAVRRLRRAIALSSAGDAPAAAGGGRDDRGLVWYHRRLLAGARAGSAGATPTSAAPTSMVGSGQLRPLHSLSNSHSSGGDQGQGGLLSRGSHHSSAGSLGSLGSLEREGEALPSHRLYGGSAGAAAVLGAGPSPRVGRRARSMSFPVPGADRPEAPPFPSRSSSSGAAASSFSGLPALPLMEAEEAGQQGAPVGEMPSSSPRAARNLTRPRSVSFFLPPPPLTPAPGSPVPGLPPSGLSASASASASSDPPSPPRPSGALMPADRMRRQEFRESREKSRRGAIVADVVTQPVFHVPVADEVTPLGLEYVARYVSVALPGPGFGAGGHGRRTGGEWVRAVKGRAGTGGDGRGEPRGEGAAPDADVVAAARINLANLLYCGLLGAQEYEDSGGKDGTSRRRGSSTSDDDEEEEEKKDHTDAVPEAKTSAGAGEMEQGGACDEERRLGASLALLQEASQGAQSSTLRAVANLNAGVVLYRRNRLRDSMAAFAEARKLLAGDGPSECEKFLDLPHYSYLKTGALLNIATVAVRLGDVQSASEAADEIDGGTKKPRAVGAYRPPRGLSGSSAASLKPLPSHIRRRIQWLRSVSTHHVRSLILVRQAATAVNEREEVDNATAVLDGYNSLLAASRKELGHTHPIVGSILCYRGDALFELRRLHPAMLSYLAALKVMESHTGSPDPPRRSDRMMYSKIWYGIARALHDREEFPDALRAYQRTLELQISLTGGSDVSVSVVQTFCNVGRVRHALGDIEGSLEVHRRVVRIATALAGGRVGHPFVAARLRALGNLLVEAGRPAEAVQAYSEAARGTGEVCVGYQDEDVDGTDEARQSARVLGSAGLADPSAAAA